MVATTLAAAPAHAELLSSEAPRRSFFAGTTWGRNEGIVSLEPLPVVSIAVLGRRGFRSNVYVGPLVITGMTNALSLCLGSACVRTPRVDFDAKLPGANASAQVIAGLGPVVGIALALFAKPTPRRQSALALGLSPLFARQGGGLQLRCVWW